jgi:SagB-type dehydrogenase family enzyme
LVDIHEQKEVDTQSALFSDLLENDIVRASPYKTHSWGWDRLSHIFHTGTKNIPELHEKRSKKEMIQDFIGFSKGYAKIKEERKKETVASEATSKCITLSNVEKASLEAPLETLSFVDTLKKRMTTRHFSGEKISEKELSTLLYYSFGEIHNGWEDLGAPVQLLGVRKSSPSAGGIHSVEAFVTIMAVEDIEPGLYTYNSKEHTLSLVHNDLSEEDLVTIMADQFYMRGLAFGVFFVSDLEKVWAKYLHSRAYREIFLDAGHLSQTLQLMATSLSLKTWVSGYFRDDELMSFLRVSEKTKAPLLFVGVGLGESTPLHPDMLEALVE